MPGIANPSADFLIACCAPGGAPLSPPEECRKVCDWRWLESAARRHGVRALVASRLTRWPQPGASDSARQRIITSGHANQLRNQYLTEQLARLLEEFRRASIATLVVKGPVLAQLAYGQLGLRTFSDLDLLVRRTSLRAAASLLAGLGFKPDLYDQAAVESGFFDTVETNFQRADRIVNVDLHWELSPGCYPFGPAGDEIWRRAIDVPLAHGSARTLAHEDHLLYLAVHSSRHGWCLLSYVCDIAYFVSRVELDWPTLLARASATRCRRMLDVGLLLARDLLGVTLPAAALEAARSNAGAGALAAAVAADLCRLEEPREFRLLQRSLGAIAGLRERARYIATHGLAPTLVDLRFCPLPRPLYPAYYLLRPIRIGSGLVRSVFSAGRSGSIE